MTWQSNFITNVNIVFIFTQVNIKAPSTLGRLVGIKKSTPKMPNQKVELCTTFWLAASSPSTELMPSGKQTLNYDDDDVEQKK